MGRSICFRTHVPRNRRSTRAITGQIQSCFLKSSAVLRKERESDLEDRPIGPSRSLWSLEYSQYPCNALMVRPHPSWTRCRSVQDPVRYASWMRRNSISVFHGRATWLGQGAWHDSPQLRVMPSHCWARPARPLNSQRQSRWIGVYLASRRNGAKFPSVGALPARAVYTIFTPPPASLPRLFAPEGTVLSAQPRRCIWT